MATATKVATHAAWQAAISAALDAGIEGALLAVPTPMIVGTPKNLMGSLLGGDDGGFDPDEPVYYVADGVCGFAWIQVKGSLKFRNYLLGRVKTAHPAAEAYTTPGRLVLEPRPDSYYGGVSIWVAGYGQSMARKEAFARAFAAKLNELVPEAGAYSMSRID